jgi:hypothetical protein
VISVFSLSRHREHSAAGPQPERGTAVPAVRTGGTPVPQRLPHLNYPELPFRGLGLLLS